MQTNFEVCLVSLLFEGFFSTGDLSSSQFLVLQQGCSATECIDFCSQRDLQGILEMDICTMEQETWSENGYFVLCFALNSVQTAEPSSCLLWHRQTDLSGSWKCWHLFGRLSDTSVPPSHFCKRMLTGFLLFLWHKYLDPWYLTQVPRHCDVTSYKEVTESLRLNRRALGWLRFVSVPMQIHTQK